MAASTVLQYHVSGPIVPQCNIGLSNAFVNIGVCEEGVDIILQNAVHDVKFDGGGGQDGFEAENVWLNAICTIRFALVPYAGAYVNRLRALSQAVGPGSYNNPDGVMGMPGTLFGMNSQFPSLYIPSNGSLGGLVGDPDGPWWFPTCRVIRPGDGRYNTKETRPQFEFRAINFINPTITPTIFNSALYTRTVA